MVNVLLNYYSSCHYVVWYPDLGYELSRAEAVDVGYQPRQRTGIEMSPSEAGLDVREGMAGCEGKVVNVEEPEVEVAPLAIRVAASVV